MSRSFHQVRRHGTQTDSLRIWPNPVYTGKTGLWCRGININGSGSDLLASFHMRHESHDDDEQPHLLMINRCSLITASLANQLYRSTGGQDQGPEFQVPHGGAEIADRNAMKTFSQPPLCHLRWTEICHRLHCKLHTLHLQSMQFATQSIQIASAIYRHFNQCKLHRLYPCRLQCIDWNVDRLQMQSVLIALQTA